MKDIGIWSTTYGRQIRTHQIGNTHVVAAFGDEHFSIRFDSASRRRQVDIGLDGVSITDAPRGWVRAATVDAPRGLILAANTPGEVKAWVESSRGGRDFVFTANMAAGVGLHTGHADSPLRQTIAVNVWTNGIRPVSCRSRTDFERAVRVINIAIDDIADVLGEDSWRRFKHEYDVLCRAANASVTVDEWDERWAGLCTLASRHRGVRRLIEDDGPAFRGNNEVFRSSDPFRGGTLGDPVRHDGAVGAGSYVEQELTSTKALFAPTLEGNYLIHWVWWDQFMAIVDDMHAIVERRFASPSWDTGRATLANLGSTPSLGGSPSGQAEHRGYTRLV